MKVEEIVLSFKKNKEKKTLQNTGIELENLGYLIPL